jgi:molecular chaperone DnaK
MSLIAGIDLGTTNSLIGVYDAGFPVLLAEPGGSRLLPSTVHYPTDGFPLVGEAAVRMRTIDPSRTIYSVKRFIGRRFAELTLEEREVEYPLGHDSQGNIEIVLPRVRGTGDSARRLRPQEISAQVLSALKDRAERILGESIDEAVLTVPAYFHDGQRSATLEAGQIAGLRIARILNEPTAAALAYGMDKLGDKSRIAVFDLGGGTFDISILELNKGVFQVLSTHGNTRLGGDDIDKLIAAHLMEQMQGGQDDPLLRARVWEAAVNAKHALSQQEETSIEIPFVSGSKNFSTTFTRTQFERLSRPVIERTRSHCLHALADAGLRKEDIDELILVGGSTRIPLVREFTRELFDREPNISQHPDEAIALGAVIQAGILSGHVSNVALLDVTPLSLGIETFGGLMNVLIPRNTTIPAKAGEMFTNAAANQTGMRIVVLQGEREMARDNWTLGSFDLPFEPAPKGTARVGVQFEIDANGILHVLARDVHTGKEHSITLRSAVDVSDDKVEQMVAESVEHAFEDMSARIFTEARLKSEEMLPAVRSALAEVGEAIDPSEREQILKLMENVERALAEENPGALKRANKALDEATEPLAALLVERAMERALERQQKSRG